LTAEGPAREVRIETGQSCLVGRFDAMASPCEILIETPDVEEARRLVDLAAAEAWRVEDKFSRYAAGNVVARINSAAGSAVEVDAETASLIDFGNTLFELSNGRFDITSGVLREVWTFDGSDRLPSKKAIEGVLCRVGWHRVDWQSPTLRMDPGMEIDFGGIGKEYAVDRVALQLREASPNSILVNFGGDLAVTRPPIDRQGWQVGIESVSKHSPTAEKVITLSAGALATSGDARRFLLRGGIRYSHILDPRTGWPVRHAPRSITVAADTCTQAGMLSTLAMLQGDRAEAFLQAEAVRHWCWRGTASQ
jgi:thiamine biosynthesis lipoprotein